MSRTKQRILTVLAIMCLSGLATGAQTNIRQSSPEQESGVVRPFKLNGAGQINLVSGEFLFGGVASHLGRYTGSGIFLPDFSIFGSIEAANGDTLDFTAAFTPTPLGLLEATFNFAGGTGRFADAVGVATGPVTLDITDFTFVFTAVGDLDY